MFSTKKVLMLFVMLFLLMVVGEPSSLACATGKAMGPITPWMLVVAGVGMLLFSPLSWVLVLFVYLCVPKRSRRSAVSKRYERRPWDRDYPQSRLAEDY